MYFAILLLASAAPAAEVVLPPDVARIELSEELPLALVSQSLSKDGNELLLVLSAPNGSCYFGLDFTGTDYKTAKIVIQGAKKWDSITYFCNKMPRGPTIDLLRLKGVKVSHDEVAKDKFETTITFAANAYKVLPPGGTLRYLGRKQ